MKIETPINYEPFDIIFLKELSQIEEDQPSDRIQQIKSMREQVPRDCIFLGELNNEIDHSPGLTWFIEDYYYLMRWNTPEYDWALFRITWDDNWGRYEWNACARIKGVNDPKKAARLMFKGLMDHWGFDLDDEDLVDDYAPYREFLEGI